RTGELEPSWVHRTVLDESGSLLGATARIRRIDQTTAVLGEAREIVPRAFETLAKGARRDLEDLRGDLRRRLEDIAQHAGDALFAIETEQHAEHAADVGFLVEERAFRLERCRQGQLLERVDGLAEGRKAREPFLASRAFGIEQATHDDAICPGAKARS